MKLFVTIYEETQEEAFRVLRSFDADHDGIELRSETFRGLDLKVFRRATTKLIILTRRGEVTTEATVKDALDAGIDFVDVEYRNDLGWVEAYRSQIILSHHDHEGMPDMTSILREMRSLRCAHTKLAVTPRDLDDNRRLLDHSAPGVTLVGMGERGLYARILAPFLGSELAFVSPPGGRQAAPGQISLATALSIYGPDRRDLRAERIFAVVGDPAGHSLSPAVHNPLFRKKGVQAAYTIASVARFDEVAQPFLTGEISGLSITTPFKEEALSFAERSRAVIGENARAANAVNTLVNVGGKILADNTDVDGFSMILAQLCGRDRKSVAVIGAGATARAAVVALDRAGMHTTIFNRTRKENARPLAELARFDGEIVIDTTPDADLDIPFRAGMSYVRAAYATSGPEERARAAGVDVFGGIGLLHNQAARQHELFMKVFES